MRWEYLWFREVGEGWWNIQRICWCPLSHHGPGHNDCNNKAGSCWEAQHRTDNCWQLCATICGKIQKTNATESETFKKPNSKSETLGKKGKSRTWVSELCSVQCRYKAGISFEELQTAQQCVLTYIGASLIFCGPSPLIEWYRWDGANTSQLVNIHNSMKKPLLFCTPSL